VQKKLENAPRSGNFLKITASFEENPAESDSPRYHRTVKGS